MLRCRSATVRSGSIERKRSVSGSVFRCGRLEEVAAARAALRGVRFAAAFFVPPLRFRTAITPPARTRLPRDSIAAAQPCLHAASSVGTRKWVSHREAFSGRRGRSPVSVDCTAVYSVPFSSTARALALLFADGRPTAHGQRQPLYAHARRDGHRSAARLSSRPWSRRIACPRRRRFG